MFEVCLVVCWITGARDNPIGDEAGDLSDDWISQGPKLDISLMAERSWERFEIGVI